jgi:hypothetical protein
MNELQDDGHSATKVTRSETFRFRLIFSVVRTDTTYLTPLSTAILHTHSQSLTTKEFPRFLSNPKVQYRVARHCH